ncbi:MAG: hypothetical protein VW397_05230 [Candidatus Margulisiibacteriota bacterium]
MNNEPNNAKPSPIEIIIKLVGLRIKNKPKNAIGIDANEYVCGIFLNKIISKSTVQIIDNSKINVLLPISPNLNAKNKQLIADTPQNTRNNNNRHEFIFIESRFSAQYGIKYKGPAKNRKNIITATLVSFVSNLAKEKLPTKNKFALINIHGDIKINKVDFILFIFER